MIALEDEIDAVRRARTETVELREGRLVHAGEEGALYRFAVESARPLAAETPVRLSLPDEDSSLDAVVAAAGDFEVLLSLPEPVGQVVSRAAIRADLSFVPAAARRRLVDVLERGGTGLVLPLALAGLAPLGSGENTGGGTASGATPTQRLAVRRAAGSRLHYVWGPPGTGKTATLGLIARALRERGERVLILALSNVAVDTAALSAAAACGSRDDGRVLRVGTAVTADLLARWDLLVDGALARRRPELAARLAALRERRGALLGALTEGPVVERRSRAAELAAVRAALADLARVVRAVEGEAIEEAGIVAATLARHVLDERLWRWPADAILLDEGGMVGAAHALAAACCGAGRLVVLGDPRQLAPIVRARGRMAEDWLARSPFEIGPAARPDEPGAPVTLLETQFRMAEPIARAVDRLAYGGRLVTASDPARSRRIAARRPWPGRALGIVDTGRLGAAGVRDPAPGSFSRAAPLSAAIALALGAAAVRGGGDAALVTPYRTQARLLAAGVRDLGIPALAAATVHRLQGSERDTIVLDLVDTAPESGPSRLTGADPVAAARLLTVALSRARGKLVVLVDLDFVEAHHDARSPVRAALAALREAGAEALDPGPELGDAWVRDWAAGESRLAADLHVADGPVQLFLADVAPSAALVEAVRAAAARAPVTAHVDPAGAVALEAAGPGVDLRLMPRPGGLIALCGSTVHVGGADARAAVVRIASAPMLARALLRLASPGHDDALVLGPVTGPRIASGPRPAVNAPKAESRETSSWPS